MPWSDGPSNRGAVDGQSEAFYTEEGVLVGRKDARTAQNSVICLSSVGTAFDLRVWARRARRCGAVDGPRARLALLLEPCRADVAKWIVMEALDRDVTRANIRDQCEYAEISPESMDTIFADYSGHFEEIPLRTFYDLGSGTGKNVFIAALTGNLIAPWALRFFLSCPPSQRRFVRVFRGRCSDICRVADAVLEDLEWVTDAGVVYCNTIMFDEPLIAALAEHASAMRPGAIFITLGQDLFSFTGEKQRLTSAFEIVGTLHTRHSFGGGVDTFIHRRRAS